MLALITIWLAFVSLALTAWSAHKELGLPLLATAPFAIAAGLACYAGLSPLGEPRLAILLAALLPACALISEVDRRHHIIPDTLVVAITLLAAASPFGDPIGGQVLGGAFLACFFYAVRSAFQLSGRDDALGLGDVKLAAAIGAFLGPYHALIAVAVAGLATISVLVVSRRQDSAALTAAGAPFGVGLSAALAVIGAARFLALP